MKRRQLGYALLLASLGVAAFVVATTAIQGIGRSPGRDSRKQTARSAAITLPDDTTDLEIAILKGRSGASELQATLAQTIARTMKARAPCVPGDYEGGAAAVYLKLRAEETRAVAESVVGFETRKGSPLSQEAIRCYVTGLGVPFSLQAEPGSRFPARFQGVAAVRFKIGKGGVCQSTPSSTLP